MIDIDWRYFVAGLAIIATLIMGGLLFTAISVSLLALA